MEYSSSDTPCPPSLLSLPVELRKQILFQAFLVICSPAPAYALNRNPLLVNLIFASDLPDNVHDARNSHIYGLWGREPMSRLLRINHQVAAEAIDVLYGGAFIFEFSDTTSVTKVKRWLNLVGDKKFLIRHIAMSTVINLKALSLLSDEATQSAMCVNRRHREAWEYLKAELPALKTVRIYFGFVNTLRGGPPGKERLMDQVMALVKVFQGVERLWIDGNRLNEERRDILRECRDWVADMG
ncbi:hypothetical protein F5884DRAFT_417 [Xylogone sp. PMI_703]|nr:hypothetical protein F5884DRAFT_417 [Xylogone sp. PMI_703]